LAILTLSGLLTLIRHAANDSIYAAPVAPGADAHSLRDAQDDTSASMSSQSQ
jgi:hypothetical protein